MIVFLYVMLLTLGGSPHVVRLSMPSIEVCRAEAAKVLESASGGYKGVEYTIAATCSVSITMPICEKGQHDGPIWGQCKFEHEG